MATNYSFIEIYDEQWGVIAQVQKQSISFMLAIHLKRKIAAQITRTSSRSVIQEMEIRDLPPIEVFENAFKSFLLPYLPITGERP